MGILSNRIAKLLLVNLENGNVDAVQNLFTISAPNNVLMRCVYTDGLFVFTEGYDNTNLVFNKLGREGNSFKKMLQQIPSVDFLDVCFDGMYFWFLTSTTVYQVSGPLSTDAVVKSWAHGLTGVRGIMTDGENIIILN